MLNYDIYVRLCDVKGSACQVLLARNVVNGVGML